MVATLPLALLPFCLIAAALNDARCFKIPNAISVVLVAGFAFAALVTQMALPDLGNHVLTALAMLVIGFALFCFNVFGAGDAKLLAAIALWFGWPSFGPCLLYIGMLGGVLSLGIMGTRMFARMFPAVSFYVPPLATLAATDKLKAPYGVAIAAGTLLAFDQSPLFDALFALVH